MNTSADSPPRVPRWPPDAQAWALVVISGRLALLWLLVLCMALGGCKSVWFAGLNSTDQRRDIVTLRDQLFDPVHQLALDVYRPRRPVSTAAAPIVVFFYGGDWTYGERAWYRFVGTALATRGVIVVIADYRKYPAVKLNGFMHDAARAVAWTQRHAAWLGGDPRQVFVMGHSSGAQIAALLATDPHWLAAYGMSPRQLAGFIGLAGCYDFVPIPDFEHDMLGMFGHDPAQQRLAQPVSFVSGHEPPMLLLHGTADKEVDPANSRSLARTMEAHDESVSLRLYPGVGHSALLFALARPLRNHAPTLSDILDFIHRQQARLDASTVAPP